MPTNGSAAAASASNGNGSTKPTPAPATASSRSGDCSLFLGIIVAVAALVVAAAVYPLTPAPKKVGFISPKAFAGIEMRPSTDNYAGSRLVIFNGDPNSCESCRGFKKFLNAKALQSKVGEWHANDVLRIGQVRASPAARPRRAASRRLALSRNSSRVRPAQVNCVKHSALCDRFDVTAPPSILWFKGNKKKGSYDGDATVEDLTKWVLSKQDTGEL